MSLEEAKLRLLAKIETVELKAGTFCLRPLSLPARDRLFREREESDVGRMSALILAGSICSESGELLDPDPDHWAELVEQADGKELEELVRAATRVSGIAAESKEEAEGN
jgi:hypothetical protein